MNNKHERIYIFLLQLTASFAILGIALLIYTRWQNGPSAIFDLMAYVVSIAALVMTTLQSLSIAQQIRITQESSQSIVAATEKLEDLVKTDKFITKELKKDIALDEQNEQLVRTLYREETNIEQRIEDLIAELKKAKK